MEAGHTIELSSGFFMPLLGLGTWKMTDGAETKDAVLEALRIGYRHIDTAKMYGNEKSVGEAVRESGVPREEIFVTTKLLPSDIFRSREAFEESLSRLGLAYIDLYLIHWPAPMMPKTVWPALERLYEEKLARSIGVSNYSVDDLDELAAYARILPSVNQIKCSPFDHDATLTSYCQAHGIVVEAYSPLTRGSSLGDPRITAIATAHAKTPAQVMLRWCIEHSFVTIPKSFNPDRMLENMDIFDWSLEPQELAALDSIAATAA
jgi:diketogulonate reductase-like aldo/keto reductase